MQCTASRSVCLHLLALVHVVTLAFDLFIPKTEAFIIVSKRIKAESLVKFSPVVFKVSH